jgi:hypothetical protein
MEKQIQTWYEITGWWTPEITKRLVSSETAAHVYHPNGRKSLKKTNRGIDWWKTFSEAKAEMLRRSSERIVKLESEISHEKRTYESINKLTEGTCRITE